MAQVARKTDLSPLEAIVVERTLGDEARRGGRETVLARIQTLAQERQKLYKRSAGRPLLGVTNSERIRALSVEIERLWELLRRERAQRRVQLERALNVLPEDDDAGSPEHDKTDASDAA